MRSDRQLFNYLLYMVEVMPITVIQSTIFFIPEDQGYGKKCPSPSTLGVSPGTPAKKVTVRQPVQ